MYLVPHKNTEFDQSFEDTYLKVKTYFQLLLDELHLVLYYLTNDNEIVIFDSILMEKLLGSPYKIKLMVNNFIISLSG